MTTEQSYAKSFAIYKKKLMLVLPQQQDTKQYWEDNTSCFKTSQNRSYDYRYIKKCVM